MNRRGITLVELHVVVILTAVLTAFAVASCAKARRSNDRVRCGSNLRQIGQALLLYANENNDRFPRTIKDGKSTTSDVSFNQGAWAAATPQTPFDGGPPINSVPSAIFLLLRTQKIQPVVFVCPSTDQSPDTLGGKPVSHSERFGSSGNLSYGVTDPYVVNAASANSGFGPTEWNALGDAEFAIAADRGPPLRGIAEPMDLTVVESDAPVRQRTNNSPNHRREGQNVLYNDGHVAFEMTAWAGKDDDNIYTRTAVPGGPPRIPDNASSLDADPDRDPVIPGTDSFILPAYP